MIAHIQSRASKVAGRDHPFPNCHEQMLASLFANACRRWHLRQDTETVGSQRQPCAHDRLIKSKIGSHAQPEFILHGPMLSGMEQPGLLVAAINISEGRRLSVVEEIAQTAGGGSKVLDLHSDPDHNRSVLTIAGPSPDIEIAIVEIAKACVTSIDLGQHEGVHPRIGALDVVPLMPSRGVSLSHCISAARSVGRRLAQDLELPCFFYELASDPPRSLPKVRRLAFGTMLPDVGPHHPHPTAGATCVGAREAIVAFNVELESDDLDAAKSIAKSLRGAEAGLPGIRALAFPLSSRGCTQVSMNLVKPLVTTPALALTKVERLATAAGLRLRSAQIIGLAPRDALVGLDPDRLHGWKPSLEEALEGVFGPPA